MARLAVFIDGGYLDALAEKEFGLWVDIEKMGQEILSAIRAKNLEPVDLFRAFYYHCLPYQGNPPTPDESRRYAAKRRFLDAVRRYPRFDVREGRLEFRGVDNAGKPVFQQKRVDLMLGIDVALLSGKQQISHVALVAGDSDFIPALEVAKNEGVSTWLFHGPRASRANQNPTYHTDLWVASDERIEIDQAFMRRIEKSRP